MSLHELIFNSDGTITERIEVTHKIQVQDEDGNNLDGDFEAQVHATFRQIERNLAMAGGKRRVVTLKTPDYSFDFEELASKVNSNTRLILLNSPHNPTGKVFNQQELSQIAKLAIEKDLLVVTDES